MIDLVITLIGPDRPGLVEAVAQLVLSHAGNWLESRMAHLGGKFAGILRVEVPSEKVAALRTALAALDTHGLKVVAEASETPDGATGNRPMRLSLLGLDRPGIVRQISLLLARHGVNVEELSTDRSSAPMSGEMLFRAQARLDVPATTDPAAVRADLERLAGDLVVEIQLADEVK
jgi:glycine cleavage system regulatory protein